jgi:eukaryotic-like serine/threonine-protein kinase
MTPDQWRQIEELYNAAQNCHPNERAALLECTDPEIRSRVERMLEVDSGSRILNASVDGAFADPTKTVVTPGAQLGPYKIEAQVGEGGMGTVYRALDTRLGRTVAIKVASERYSERFQREARAISTLNHPNICTLYDVGPNYLVMEFIDGSTLAAEIKKGPLALESVARYGAQIANALAEAHALGIVHRDLKPSNIMVTRHGVKVLDFGLAKILPGTVARSETGLTETGGVMGTPAYMAPEQVEGREPSSVTDLFSLGLVLYEMAAGKLPYPGASLGQMLSSGSRTAIPAASGERAAIPASLDALIARLLEREPAKRPQSAAEVAGELATITERAPESRPRFLSIYAIAATVVLVVLGAGSLWMRSRWGSLSRGGETPIAANPAAYTQLTSFTDSAVWPTLSPDGRMLAFYRTESPFMTFDQIWVKLLPNGEPVQVTHDPRQKYNIAFSPDGARIAYTAFHEGDTRFPFETDIVSALGGESQLMLPNSAGLSWLNKDQLLLSQIRAGIHMGVVTAAPDRSQLREIYFPVHERGMVHYSYLSPDRKWLLLVEMVDQFRPCRVVPFAGGSEGRQVGPPGATCTSAAWSPDGKWMYLGVQVAGQYHLWRQRFPDGQPEQLTFGSTEEGGIAVLPDGRSLITSIITFQRAVWIHDSRGERALSSEGYPEVRPPVFSRDGRQLYYLVRHDSLESPAELWRAEVDSGKAEVVLPGVSVREYDISNDEKEVVYSTQPAGKPSELWMAALDHSTPPRRISASSEDFPHFGPNGEIVFRQTDGSAYYVAAMQPDGSGARRIFPSRVLNIRRISPDRRFLMIDASLAGTTKLNGPAAYALPLTGGGPKWICNGICDVSWSPDGRYFYVETVPASRENKAGQTIVIRVPGGSSFPPTPPGDVLRPENWAKLPGAKIVDHAGIGPGLDPSVYAYVKSSTQANLFRIPLR